MTKEVLISIKGFQFMEGDSDSVEVITPGEYYIKNGKHYILYEEAVEGTTGTVSNVMKLYEDSVSIRKKGLTNAYMVFSRGEKHLTCYSTSMGDLMMGIHTKDIRIRHGAERMEIEVDYGLELNDQSVADCELVIDIRPRNQL